MTDRQLISINQRIKNLRDELADALLKARKRRRSHNIPPEWLREALKGQKTA